MDSGEGCCKKGQSFKGLCLNPKVRHCGFKKEEATKVVEGGKV